MFSSMFVPENRSELVHVCNECCNYVATSYVGWLLTKVGFSSRGYRNQSSAVHDTREAITSTPSVRRVYYGIAALQFVSLTRLLRIGSGNRCPPAQPDKIMAQPVE
jgi:hypothetical protein